MLVASTPTASPTRVGEDGRFGEARLLETLRGVTDAAGAVAAIDAALNAFQRGVQADDTACWPLDIPTGFPAGSTR